MKQPMKKTNRKPKSSQGDYKKIQFPADLPLIEECRELAELMEAENPVDNVSVPIYAAVRQAVREAIDDRK